MNDQVQSSHLPAVKVGGKRVTAVKGKTGTNGMWQYIKDVTNGCSY